MFHGLERRRTIVDSSSSPARSLLTVSVYDQDQAPLSSARVTLKGPKDRKPLRLNRGKGTSSYLIRDASPGSYVLVVESKGLESQERLVELKPGVNSEVIVLGEEGRPHYYRGTTRVPFRPRPDLVALSLWEPEQAEIDELSSLCEKLRLTVTRVPEEVQRTGVSVLELRGRASEKRVREVLTELVGLSQVRHAGQIVHVRDCSISFLTDELLVRFKPHVTEPNVREIAKDMDLGLLRFVPYSDNTAHLSSAHPGTYEILDQAMALMRLDEVVWAEPNLVTTPEPDVVTPGDFLWPALWDRQLVGLPNAWGLLEQNGLEAFGEPTIVMAVVDVGIKSAGGTPTHPEFQGDVSDGSDKIYKLYNFGSLVPNNDSTTFEHGMWVAGVAGAKANNVSPVPGYFEGVVGAAPNCRLMGLVYPSSEADKADMYIWAAGFDPNSPRPGFPGPISPGADIIVDSSGSVTGPLSGVGKAMLDFLMTYGRGGRGCLCFFSAGNNSTDATIQRPYAAYEKSFGIAASTLADDGATEIRASYSNYGPVKFCAPSGDGEGGYNPPTTYSTWTTSVPGSEELIGHPAVQTTLASPASAGDSTIMVTSIAGFVPPIGIMIDLPDSPEVEPRLSFTVDDVTNEVHLLGSLDNDHPQGTLVSGGPFNYGPNFGGTSSATPLAAGVAALMLSANLELTWVDVQEILRQTSIKIDPANADPVGQWLDANGNPSVASGSAPWFSFWYGYGRIDAAAAVNQALSYSLARDIVVRDNLADEGAVPSGIPFWNSPDIWVRNVEPSVEGSAALPADYGAPGPHVSPIAGQDNWVYVRCRNVGSAPSIEFWVRAYISHFPGLEFTYPGSFVPTNRPGQDVPSPMVPGTYLIGEVLHSQLAAGDDVVVAMRWPADLVPPAMVDVGGSQVEWHPCLLAEISPHDGPTPSGSHVWDDNNLAQKNLSIVHVTSARNLEVGVVVGNLEHEERYVILDIDASRLPRGLQTYIDVVEPNLANWLAMTAEHPRLAESAMQCVTLLEQAIVSISQGSTKDLPNIERLAAGTRLYYRGDLTTGPKQSYGYEIRLHRGRKVAFLHKPRARIPLRHDGKLLPLKIGIEVPEQAPNGIYPLHIVQRDPQGSVSGGASIEIRTHDV